MRSGDLNERVTVYTVTTAPDDLGSLVETETALRTVWAAVEPLSGKEYWNARQTASEVSVRIRIRYNAAMSVITAKDVVKHGSVTYDIEVPLMKMGPRRDEIHLMCTRRP